MNIAFYLLMFGMWPAGYFGARFYFTRVQGLAEPVVRDKMAVALRPQWIRFHLSLGLVIAGTVLWILFDRDAVFSGLRHGWLIGIALAGFHVHWWVFAMPLLIRQQRLAFEHGVMARPGHHHAVRVASLTPRKIADDIPRALLVLPFILGIALLGSFITRAVIVGIPTRDGLFAGGYVFMELLVVVLYAVWIRWETSAPQTLVGTGELGDQYQREVRGYRRFRVRCVYWIGVLFFLLFSVMAMLHLEVASGNVSPKMIGSVGGFAGSAVGIFGAVFGVVSSVRSSRLHRLKAKIDSLQTSS